MFYMLYICVCVCLIYVVIYVIYVIYIYTQYITLYVSHESWFMWDSPNATMALNQVSTVSHWDVAALAREFQVTKSRTQGPGSCQDSKTEITGDASLQQRSKLWHFELTVVYSHLFSDVIWNRSAMEPGEVTPVMHGEGDGQLQKRGWFCLSALCLCLLYGSIGKESLKNLALWQFNLADLPFTIWLWLTVSELENHHAINT